VINYRDAYESVVPYRAFLAGVDTNAELWRAIASHATVDAALVRAVEETAARWHLLILAEDWCGDAVNTLPYFGALGERADNVEVRVLARDQNLQIMDAHLTNGARSIPVVIILDENFLQRARWAPRPDALQRWFNAVGRGLQKDERYREMRRWYARDRGRTSLCEVADLIRAAAGMTPGTACTQTAA
jgi:hypothetical protein